MKTLLPQNPEKPRLVMRRCEVWKIHSTEAAAMLEAAVANAFADAGQAHGVKVLRPLAVTTVLPRGCAVRYRRVEGLPLRRVGSVGCLRELVFALALFHARFATAPGSSIVRYRDALPMNVVVADDGLWQIDFSSSDSHVHAFDDLALLLNRRFVSTGVGQTRDFLAAYIGWRRSLETVLARSDRRENPTTIHPAEVRSAYAQKVISMEVDSGRRGALQAGLENIDFEAMRPCDFRWFKTYREIRLAHYERNIWQEQL